MITFENSPVNVAGLDLLASTVSISLSDPRRGTKRFGTPGFDSQVRQGPAEGRVSISYYLTDTNSGVSNLFTGDGIQLFDISVGEYRCYSGVVNSMSMNIEPYSAVSCTLDISFYSGYDQGGTAGSLPTPPDVIHGGASEVSSDLLWGSDLASCQYALSHSISPVYPLGSLFPTGFTREDGSVEISLAGTGLGHIIDFSTVCEGYTAGAISLTGICEGTEGGTIPFSGYVVDPEITVAPNEEIKGSLTIFGVF